MIEGTLDKTNTMRGISWRVTDDSASDFGVGRTGELWAIQVRAGMMTQSGSFGVACGPCSMGGAHDAWSAFRLELITMHHGSCIPARN